MTPRVLTPDDVVAVTPPADLCQRVLAQQYPDTSGSGRQLARPAGGHRQATPPPPLETANPTPA